MKATLGIATAATLIASAALVIDAPARREGPAPEHAPISGAAQGAPEAADLLLHAAEGRSPYDVPGAADPRAVERAVKKGLVYLKRTQDPTTGGWVCNVGYKFNSDYHVTARRRPHVGVTAMALMAFLSGGHLPGRGEHGDVVERGTNYILSCVDPKTGYISDNGTRMYSHAFASLFLAEIYGMTHRTDVKQFLKLATDCTVKSQNQHGSWRYLPQSPLSDMSITVCQIMALRAARNIGIRVPKSTIDRAQAYVDRSAIKRTTSPHYGAFRYQETGRSRTTFPLAAAGLATLFHAGIYDQNELMDAGLGYLRRNLRRFTRTYLRRGHYFFWYGQYYAAQVFFFADDMSRYKGIWSKFYWPHISKELVRTQRPDGSWLNRPGPGTDFSTAVATVVLQIPNHYLPIFQR